MRGRREKHEKEEGLEEMDRRRHERIDGGDRRGEPG